MWKAEEKSLDWAEYKEFMIFTVTSFFSSGKAMKRFSRFVSDRRGMYGSCEDLSNSSSWKLVMYIYILDWQRNDLCEWKKFRLMDCVLG